MNTEQKKRKPRGWKGRADDYWYTKDSAYGAKYMCSECHRQSLGIAWGKGEIKMHWQDCPRRIALEEKIDATF